MIGADSQPGRQQQRGKMHVAQPKWRQFSVEDGGLLEIVFFAIKVPFVGSQFLTDFYSQKRCLCSKRSHGPLLRAFCLCFYFKQVILRLLSRPSSCLTVTCLSATCVAVLTNQLCCAHPSSCLTCLSAACVGVLTSQLCCAHPSSCLTCLCRLYCSVDQSVVLCSPVVLPDMSVCRLCCSVDQSVVLCSPVVLPDMSVPPVLQCWPVSCAVLTRRPAWHVCAACVGVLTSQLCCAHPSSCLTCLSAACVGVLTSQLCCAHPSSCLTCLCRLYCSVDQSVVLCSPIVLPDMCRLCWKCWSVLLVLTWPSTNLQVLTSSPCWRRDAACLALLLTLSASLVGDAELCSALPHIGCTTLWTEERFSNLTQHCARSVGNNGTAMRVTKSITFVKVLIVLT